MELEIKRTEHMVPSYSLTGDLLSYLRCRLQYRYYNGSALPPSRPVQLWFGSFIHGTLEMSYSFWKEACETGKEVPAFPWPCTKHEWQRPTPDWEEHDIGKFASIVENNLRQQGIQARSADTRDAAYLRIELAVNELGPILFPLIASAERKVIGTRPVPAGQIQLRCDNYEVHGVIDVLTHITLSKVSDSNPIRQHVQDACRGLHGTYEVIVDYKGTRRPRLDEPYWDQGNWQIQTYAWLRQRQPEALPVAAGILLYINELMPGGEEMRSLQQGLRDDSTDIRPAVGSRDAQIIRMWRSGMDTRQLSLDFRLRRAIRAIPINDQSIKNALDAFDDVVRRAEEDIQQEASGRNILQSWSPNCRDSDTCAACDFRHFCPKPARTPKCYNIKAPTAP